MSRATPTDTITLRVGTTLARGQLLEDDEGVWLVVEGYIKLDSSSSLLKKLAIVEASEEQEARLRQAGFELAREAAGTG